MIHPQDSWDPPQETNDSVLTGMSELREVTEGGLTCGLTAALMGTVALTTRSLAELQHKLTANGG